MISNPVMKKLGRRLRLGVIGGGPGSFIGSVHRGAAVLEEMYDVVAGVLSSDPERSLSAAKELGIGRAYSSAEEMFAAEADRADGMDLVAIMTPNNSHYRLACQALEAGFHVMCEKPLTNDLNEALDLVNRVQASDRQFCVAYGYTGYPMVRQARAMVEAGELGEIRMVQCEYVQGHLAELTASEQRGQNWHMDPSIAGPSLILGDIATHSYHLASYVSGMEPTQINADVTTVVPGREAHDYAGIQLRYANNARGMLWITQAAAGASHGLYLRIFGSKGGLEWHQEQPNELLYRRLDAPVATFTKGGPGLSEAANRVTRIAIGHPEGYREAFANLYSDLAEAIVATETGTTPEPLSLWYPNIQDGASGVRFVQAALRSSENGGSWEPCGPDLQTGTTVSDHR
jgi:predicted dehydrogenase